MKPEKKVSLCIRIPVSLMKSLRQTAVECDCSMTSVIVNYLRTLYKKRLKKNANRRYNGKIKLAKRDPE